ncbi:UDP-glucuronosyltransferase 2A1-like isoform X1 [Clupea harengus]|uniref:UDP-glucuronosyltransferase n=2 Tax=Clupea harengus TaxID=7950 RepID=A0A6P8FNB4_CLUHA|nr:UDP-glucuronosyltransferase 2A1-like isoform X1 [Clupea harengus]
MRKSNGSAQMLSLAILSSLLCLTLHTCHGGKVLVYPVEGSHWVNMNILIEGLHSKGHDITVLRSDKSWYIKENSSSYNTITVPVSASLDEEFIAKIVTETINIQRGHSSLFVFVTLLVEMFKKLKEAHVTLKEMIVNILENPELVKSLQDCHYDILLTDPCWGGGTVLAHYLHLPLVYNVRWLPVGEGHFAVAPSPVSYIPLTGSGFSDKMTFIERVKNMLYFGAVVIQDRLTLRPVYQGVCEKYLSPHSDFYMLMQSADLWLMRGDFVFEFPRPTMPNVVYMGGFQCKPAKPLPQDLEDFVQSSGEHGVILMSLGTFVSQLPSDITEEIAAAFAELPQKVIWKYTGERPSTLGNNTLLVDWMPQNDILGHPKIKLFVAHGGTNGVQEALYHGVPVVGIPLFFDQYDNLLRLKVRGGATILSVATLEKGTLLQGLQEVLHEPSYRENMQRLSRLHRDQPMKPLDRALFWIEFVMRHKGAAHLRTESYKMPWYAYHSVDVVLFLVAVLSLIVLIILAVIRYLLRLCNKIKNKVD